LNTQIALFSGPIALNFFGQSVLNQLTTNKIRTNPVGKKTIEKLTWRVDFIPSAQKIKGCKYQLAFKGPAHGLEGFGLGCAANMYVVIS